MIVHAQLYTCIYNTTDTVLHQSDAIATNFSMLVFVQLLFEGSYCLRVVHVTLHTPEFTTLLSSEPTNQGRLLFEGGNYSRVAFISLERNQWWLDKVHTSDTVTTVRHFQRFAQPLSPAVSRGNELYNVNSSSASPMTIVRNHSHTCVCRNSTCSSGYYLRTAFILFRVSDCAATIWGRHLFEQIRYIFSIKGVSDSHTLIPPCKGTPAANTTSKNVLCLICPLVLLPGRPHCLPCGFLLTAAGELCILGRREGEEGGGRGGREGEEERRKGGGRERGL